MKIGDAVRLRPGSRLRARLAPFAEAVGCVVDTFQDDDDYGVHIGVAFPTLIKAGTVQGSLFLRPKDPRNKSPVALINAPKRRYNRGTIAYGNATGARG